MSWAAGEAPTAGDLLTLEELADLRRLSTPRGLWLVGHAWAVIAAAVGLYVAWPSALTLAVAVVVIGARQLGLLVLMHETAHWRLCTGGPLNTRIGTWLCAAPVGADLKRYRRRHHLHHRHTRQAEDPDLPLSSAVPATRAALLRAVLADLCGVTACARLARWRPWRDRGSAAWARLRAPLAANAVLFCALAAVGGWSLYLLVWVLPWATWLQLLTRLRDMAEHGMVASDVDPLRNTRTIAAGWPARALLAPYWVNHHLEHHLLVFVPCWKLVRVRALLLAKALGPRMEMAASYGEVVRRAAAATR